MAFVAALCLPPPDTPSPATAATVITTIHQPSEAIFDLSADLVLMGKGGRVCYAGPTQGARAFVLDVGQGLPSLPSPLEVRPSVPCCAVSCRVVLWIHGGVSVHAVLCCVVSCCALAIRGPSVRPCCVVSCRVVSCCALAIGGPSVRAVSCRLMM